ncbi:unnamed protein product [Moneuplotes crassus]|uniref:Uncharacterized protein n=1 Tax=Euplotes crassus TaxID=5936 RepID=A0AAD1XM41_EUPCR|nr:unnamed protein product [Moneuplotes crassus]
MLVYFTVFFTHILTFVVLEAKSHDKQVKLILIGDYSVGKSSILHRYCEDAFWPKHMPTIGVDFRTKFVRDGNNTIKMQLWDTAGQEKYRTVTSNLYKNTSVVLLVYDCTDLNSFDNVANWIKQIEMNVSEKTIIILIANKIDLENRLVSTEDGEAMAEAYRANYFETSAKTGQNIDKVFDYCVENIMNYTVPRFKRDSQRLKRETEKDKAKAKKKRGFCRSLAKLFS